MADIAKMIEEIKGMTVLELRITHQRLSKKLSLKKLLMKSLLSSKKLALSAKLSNLYFLKLTKKIHLITKVYFLFLLS